MILKIFISLFLYINTCISQNCYTTKDVIDKGLVSYENKVYDIKNYIHPGGQRTLLLSKGKNLEEFFNMDEYKFHTISPIVTKDLEKIYIGNLYTTCGNTYNNQTNPLVNNITNRIVNNPNFLFSTITLSLFLVLCISANITNYINFSYFNYKFCNFFISSDLILFYLIYVLWWITLLLLSIFSNDEILERLGIWISLNISFTILPVTKNSIWAKLLKISYSKLIEIHKTISILCVLSVLAKILTILILYNYKYLYINNSNVSGLLCSISIVLTSILATPLVRKNIFELFYYSHKFLSIFTIISMSFHYILCLYYVLPAIILYLIDILIRRLKTRKAIYTKVDIHNFENYKTSYIFVSLSLLKSIDINPGCYFLLCCNNISNVEWHPLSLILSENNNLLFCIKNMGVNSWSDNLKKLTNTKYLFQEYNTYLQGPYYHINLNYNYDYIINIANGIGVTPFFSILKHLNNNFKFKKVLFIWIIPDMCFLTPFINLFKNLDNIEIQIFLTKGIHDNNQLFETFTIFNNKPDIYNYIKNFIDMNNIKNTKKISIISCGSKSLIDDVYKASSKFSIDLYNETF